MKSFFVQDPDKNHPKLNARAGSHFKMRAFLSVGLAATAVSASKVVAVGDDVGTALQSLNLLIQLCDITQMPVNVLNKHRHPLIHVLSKFAQT